MNALISSNENSFGEGQVSFYRFKMKKNDTENIENQTNQSS